MTTTDIQIVGGGRVVLAAAGVPLWTTSTTSAGSSGGGSSGGGSSGGGSSGGSSGGGSSGGSSGGGGVTDILVAGGGGQSNLNYAASDGSFAALATAAGFYVQATSATGNFLYADDGVGLDNLTTPDGNGNYTGSFVLNTDATTTLAFYNNTRFGYTSAAAANIVTLAAERATAPFGAPGSAYAVAATALGGGVANTQALFAYWLETDCLQFTPVSAPLFRADVLRWMALTRAVYGKTAAQLPFFWMAPPYGLFPNLPSGPPCCREVLAELAADPANNMVWLSQTYDTFSRNEIVVSGVGTGGNTDGGHRSAIDNVALFKRSGLAVARAILAANGLSASLPTALGQGMGPSITGVTISGMTLTLTVTHDGGTDLVVPLLAPQGVGFAVMDGGSTAAPGNIIMATSCSRVDSTHLSVTLASAPVNGAGGRRLCYPWAGTYWTAQPDSEIGRGCAVTDNFAAVSKPSGFDINASLGSGWAVNMPLQIPMTLTGSGSTASASYGFVF